MHTYAIVGAGGFGREVMPLVEETVRRSDCPDYRIVFVVEGEGEGVGLVNGYEVWNKERFFSQSGAKYFNIAIASSESRERIAAEFADNGAHPFSITALNSLVLESNQIGDAAILCPFVTVTSNVRIGKYFHANIYSYVAHDCHIGDFVTFAPRVSCNGNVVIEDHAYIGTGAVIKQGSANKPLRIGRGAVIGMGAVVTKDVPPGATVVGNPARPFVAKR